MSFKIITTAYADKAIKKLSKRYHSFSNDIKAFREELLNNPLQGDEIAPHVRKIRMAITWSWKIGWCKSDYIQRPCIGARR